jgi:hypothetical protein
MHALPKALEFLRAMRRLGAACSGVAHGNDVLIGVPGKLADRRGGAGGAMIDMP